MRLFIAIEVAPDIRVRIEETIHAWQPRLPEARWVRADGLHITLKFLGEAPEAKLSDIQSTLAAVAGEPFPIAMEGIGTFPNPRAPRVLWVGVNAGPPLPQLAGAVDSAMNGVGFATETKPFRPHITLARFKPGVKANVAPLLEAPPPSFGTMTATEFHLYESKLSPRGSQYRKLASFALHA